MNIRDRIQQEADMWRQMQAPALLQTFILNLGQEYKAAPFSGTRMTPKECFSNAAQLSTRRHKELTYVEGYGWRNSLPLLIHHAWCVTADGTVVDPTWSEPEECQYFGIPFTQEKLWEELTRLKFYGLFDTPNRGYNVELMIRMDPKIKEMMK